ncbi:hypothetical protein D3C86_2096440 [compost metagenome]
MDFIINHVRQLDHVHDTDSNLALKALACTSVIKHRLTVTLHACFFHRIENVILARAVEYRRCCMNAKMLACHAKVNFKRLPDVHP